MKSDIWQFEEWLNQEFIEINTSLEEIYFKEGEDVINPNHSTMKLKRTLLESGTHQIKEIMKLAINSFDPNEQYVILGKIGIFLAACIRHQIPLSHENQLEPAWELSKQIGLALGVAPRYVFGHQVHYSKYLNSHCRTFTSLKDEEIFVQNNGLSVLEYQGAAEALRGSAFCGLSSPFAHNLFKKAKAALDAVLNYHIILQQTLNADRFYLNIRPYFRPITIGKTLYRGTNAGDFSAVHEIDQLLGMCQAKDPFYKTILEEKFPFLHPQDQSRIKSLHALPSLLDAFINEAERNGISDSLRKSGMLFIGICKAHAAASVYHYERLVKTFLVQPAREKGQEAAPITASGPPLETVLEILEHLKNLRGFRPLGSSASRKWKTMKDIFH